MPATFFQCGANVRRLPEIAREVAAAGHEIGNHTDTHPMFTSKAAISSIGKSTAAQETIERVTGARPRYFRAPYGVRWFGLREAQRRLGLTGVMWTTLAMDWKRPVERVVSRLLRGASNGAILCLHDGRALQSGPDIRVTLEAVRASSAKIDGARLPFRKGDRHPMSNEELTERVRGIIAATQHVAKEKITADSTFEELGIDSLDGINILFAVESEFNINIPDDAAQNIRSVRDVIEGIAKLIDTGQGGHRAVQA